MPLTDYEDLFLHPDDPDDFLYDLSDDDFPRESDFGCMTIEDAENAEKKPLNDL
jgi:hypothetical protein